MTSTGRIGIGCEQLGGTDWGTVDVAAATRAIRTAWDHGVRLFDTADVYGLGLSEERLADALGRHRHEARIVTKSGVRWEATAGSRARIWKDHSPAYIRTAVANSLRRLRLEALPVLLVHWPDGTSGVEETMAELKDLQMRGHVVEFGVSNFHGAELDRAVDAGATVCELPFSMARQDRATDLEKLGRRGVDRITYGTFEQGLLTGRTISPESFGPDDRRHRLPLFQPAAIQASAPARDALRQLARDRDLSVTQLVVAWSLHHDAIDHPLVGVRSPAQVAQVVTAQEISLDQGTRASLAAIEAQLRIAAGL